MALFSAPTNLRLPLPEEALPGRDEPMAVSGEHAVSGNRIVPPCPPGLETAIVGMGCFWGAERKFWEAPGVFSTAVGYAGGHTPNPTYKEVCSGLTGHTEAVLVVFDPSQISYDREGSSFAAARPADFDWDRLLEGVGLLHLSGITPALGPLVA